MTLELPELRSNKLEIAVKHTALAFFGLTWLRLLAIKAHVLQELYEYCVAVEGLQRGIGTAWRNALIPDALKFCAQQFRVFDAASACAGRRARVGWRSERVLHPVRSIIETKQRVTTVDYNTPRSASAGTCRRHNSLRATGLGTRMLGPVF